MTLAPLVTVISWYSAASVNTRALSGDKHPRHQMTFRDFAAFNWFLWTKHFVS